MTDTASSPSTESTPRRIAVIVAHPDDAEFTCAGTVARWVREGNEIHYVLITSGDKGSDDPNVSAEHLIAMRETEQRAACDILGVHDVHFLRRPDASLVHDTELRRELVRVIRRVQPDVVVCQDPTVRFVGQSYLNHPDHRAAGDATLDAIYPFARDRMTFPELLAEGLEPHKVAEVYLTGAGEPDVWFDISETMPTKLAALRAHASQLRDWDPTDMMMEWAKGEADKHPGHGELVEGFRYFKLE